MERVVVENNALSSHDEKQRQDAKWSLPYLEGKKKEDAEKLIAELNEKDAAFDVALGAACHNLSSVACNGMRQELAAMAKSYDKQLDGQYIGNMRSVYKDGAKQVDAQMWQYATADAKAEREANVTRLAENWGVSREAADKLYTTMAGIHTAAAIGGAVYGMKGVGEKPATPATKPGSDTEGINKPKAKVTEPAEPKTGTINVSINKGQQNKHIPGTNEYKIASDSGLNKSVITVPSDTLLSKIGTGQQVGKTPIGSPGSKERINYGKTIGNYIDPQTGVSTPTTNGIVHYGKNGVHIVPARPSE